MKVSNLPYLLIFFGCSIGCTEKPVPSKQILIMDGFSNEVLGAFWLYLPKNYGEKRKWPIIMFLQGGDASASPTPNTVKNGGPVNYMLNQHKALPDSFIIVNPHMRTGTIEQCQWYKNAHGLVQIINQTIKNNHVDPGRI